MKFYGSLNNRLEENKMYCDEIKVGTGMTEYSWSDRHAYEVVEVIDQKHVIVREYDHKLKGGAYSNDWELISNENNPTKEMVKRGNYWYAVSTITREMVSKELTAEERIYLALNGYDINKIKEKGKQSKYYRMNVSFGTADYYYDYEF